MPPGYCYFELNVFLSHIMFFCYWRKQAFKAIWGHKAFEIYGYIWCYVIGSFKCVKTHLLQSTPSFLPVHPLGTLLFLNGYKNEIYSASFPKHSPELFLEREWPVIKGLAHAETLRLFQFFIFQMFVLRKRLY